MNKYSIYNATYQNEIKQDKKKLKNRNKRLKLKLRSSKNRLRICTLVVQYALV